MSTMISHQLNASFIETYSDSDIMRVVLDTTFICTLDFYRIFWSDSTDDLNRISR